MRRSALFLPALVLTLGGLVTGCGGSDGSDASDDADGGSSAAPAISHDDFIEQADAICTQASTDLGNAGADLGPDDDLVAFIQDTAVPNFQAQHDDIEALGAPDGEEDDVQALLDALQDGIDAVSAAPEDFTSSDANPFAEANTAADDLGLTVCGG